MARCTVHGIFPINENKLCQFCEVSTYIIETGKLYTGKEIFMMESPIVDFHQGFYIHAIQKLAFHLTHVRIIGTHHCGARVERH